MHRGRESEHSEGAWIETRRTEYINIFTITKLQTSGILVEKIPSPLSLGDVR